MNADLALSSRPATKLDDYLGAVEAFALRYIAFPSEHEPVAFALWVAHAHVVERFEVSPILAVTSAEMRSGKTRVLDVAELIVPTPYRVITPSEAVTYTILAQRPRPTLLLDEADAIFGPRTAERYEGLRAILNSGNRQGTSVPRTKLDGKRRDVEWFDVYGPKAVAGIGDLPSTVADRSIPLRMKRRAPTEIIDKFRRRKASAEAAAIAFDWERLDDLPEDPPVPDDLNDRAADSWEPLFSIADVAGQPWARRARLAAVALSGDDEVPISVGMRLLADIRDIFGEREHLTTSALLAELHDLEDGPWADWYGSPLSGRALAKLLGPYRVAPVQRRVRGDKSRGYFAADFLDAWKRYVPLLGTGTSGTSGTLISVGSDETAQSESVSEHGVPDVPDVPVPQTATQLDFEAPLCEVCGRRRRAVPTVPGRYVCTFPHTAYQGASA